MSTEMVSYRAMSEMTPADCEILQAYEEIENAGYPDRLIAAVKNLQKYQGPVQVDRFEHSLQSATRAHRDGRDEEYVVAALLHDIGDGLAPHSHGLMVGAILKPYISERYCWMVEKHTVFQFKYRGHLIGVNPDVRDKYKDHPYYDDCAEFCEKYDQNCFDPNYDTLPLSFFEPMVHRVFGKEPGVGEEDVG
jgi:predicted HD phosphohydrolase